MVALSQGTFEEWAARALDVGRDAERVAAYVLEPGASPTVTFLHGFPSSSFDVAPVAALLDDVCIVALDFPGFGASAKPANEVYSIHGAADAVERVWHHAGVTETVLLAHDYGVSVGQELLARQLDGTSPVEIDAVVWCNGGLYADLHRPTIGQHLLLDPDHGAEVAAALDEAAFADGIRSTWGTRLPLDPAVVHEMWVSMARDGGIRLAHRLLHYVADRREHGDRWIGALEAAALPMLFVWGELDPVSGAHVADRLADRRPRGSLRRLANVGHWPPLEAPADVARAVRDLLLG
jgi:pimeloyl-ACP methyl ester carboxylesterase